MTQEFSGEWLAAREPYDVAARSPALAATFMNSLPPSRRILDLGAGQGANSRYLQNLAAVPAKWRLVDSDPDLLQRITGISGTVEKQCMNFAPDPALIDLSGIDGLTGSALFDLVSRDWFARLVRAASGLPLLAALTVNGTFEWSPSHPSDDLIMTAFRADMRRDKGFGPAMGVAAPQIMTAILRQAGYRVRTAQSPWRLGPNDTRFMMELIQMFAEVASQSLGGDCIDAWRGRRLSLAEGGDLRLVVGHEDIVAL